MPSLLLFLLLLPSPCSCLILATAAAVVHFIHLPHTEKAPGGAGGRDAVPEHASVRACVCVCECVNTSLMHKQKQAGSSLAASCQKEERKVPNLISARELLVRELETFPLCRALKKVKALFKFFMAPLHLQRAEVISPRKRYVY